MGEGERKEGRRGGKKRSRRKRMVWTMHAEGERMRKYEEKANENRTSE